MPSVTLYLNDEILEAVKSRAASRSVAVSNIVREAIEEYLKRGEKQEAKKAVIEALKGSDFGGIEDWEEIHRERETSNADRP